MTVVGLAQLWILFTLDHLAKTMAMPDIFRDGVLLFFAMAVVAAVAIEYHFAVEVRLPKWIEGVLFALIPFITAMFVTAAYVGSYLLGETNLKADQARCLQYIALAIALLYAILGKGVVFLNSWRAGK